MLLLLASLAFTAICLNVVFVFISNYNIILNWLTFSNSKGVGKEEEKDSEAVSFTASSATLFLYDFGTSLQKQTSFPFLSKKGILIFTSCSAVLV